MKNNLETNADHYPTEKSKIADAENRIGCDAAKHIAPRMIEAPNKSHTAEEIFTYFHQVFGDLTGNKPSRTSTPSSIRVGALSQRSR